jgi:uncharacterized membrane protein YccC
VRPTGTRSPRPSTWSGLPAAQIHARAAAPASSPASTTVSKQSLLADLANLREQNKRLRKQNTDLTARLSELLGEEVFRASGIGRTDEAEALRARVGQLEQELLDLRQELEERTDDLAASRAANRDLMALANRKPAGPPRSLTGKYGQVSDPRERLSRGGLPPAKPGRLGVALAGRRAARPLSSRPVITPGWRDRSAALLPDSPACGRVSAA